MRLTIEISELENDISLINQEILNLELKIKMNVEEIDKKHAQYMKNAVMRARFQLATGNNIEGKLSRILGKLAEEYNEMPDEQDELMSKFLKQ